MPNLEQVEVGSWDSVLLEDLSEDNFISNLCQRYKRDHVYTYLGTYLIFLNPYKPLSIYSNEAIWLYSQKSLFKLPPHIYGVANSAYQWLQDLNEDQCIVMTGESSAGKTETARLVVDFLTKISQIKRLNRSTTSLGSNRSLNSSNSRQTTPTRIVTVPKRIIRARSTENEPLNYGSLRKQGSNNEKSVNFDFTKYKSTENLMNHQLLVPKCQIHHHSPTSHQHFYPIDVPKSCPKHNPEVATSAKKIAKCESCLRKSSTSDLRSVKSPIINPHCRIHATPSKPGKLAVTSPTTAQIIPKPNLYQLDGLGRRARTPPPSAQVPNYSGAYHPTSSYSIHHHHVQTGKTPKTKTTTRKIGTQCDTTLSLKTILRGSTATNVNVMRDRVANAEHFLNAMGHAMTHKNWNSSRFGKLFDIEFDFKGDIVGGHISHYMLEKARVTNVRRGERNFHIFYQLLAGADMNFLKQLKLHRNVDKYDLLRNTFTNEDDKASFSCTKQSLEMLGLSPDEVLGVFKILAVILKMGNLSFVPVTNIDGTEGCCVSNDYELNEIAYLLDIDAKILLVALTRTEMLGGGSHEQYSDYSSNWTELDAVIATRNKSLLCRTLYGRLFTWTMSRINESLKAKQYIPKKSFGVLDFYGFECIEINSFEQLAINYSNERIHQNFLQNVLKFQQELYIREGLDWLNIDFFDNESICELIDKQSFGILKLLDEVNTEETLSARVQQCCSGHPNFHPVLSDSQHGSILTGFQIRHFAGPVNYKLSGFLEKNLDLLPRSVSMGLFHSRAHIVQTLFPEGNPKRMSKRPTSNGTTLRISIQTLLQTLDNRKVNYVFCVKPNEINSSGSIELPLIQHQVRYLNLMPLVRLWRSGHCFSMFHVKFFCRYKLLNPVTWPTYTNGALIDGIAIIIENLPLPIAEFVITRKRVFIRSPRTVFELEELRKERLDHLAILIQTAFRCYAKRKWFLKLRRSQVIIASAWRTWRDCRLGVSTTGRRHLFCLYRVAREEYRIMKYRKQVEWAVGVIQRQYMQWKRRQFLLTLPLRFVMDTMSPTSLEWPTAPSFLAETNLLLRNIHHRWRCYKYRKSFDQTSRNRMREKVTASIIFKDRKALYNRSVSHPFLGDYVRLRQNVQWKKISVENNDQYVVFADIINKITRSSGKFVPILLVLSTSSMLLLDQRTLQVKYRVPAAEIYRLSLSPYLDDVAVFHVRASEMSRKKGDFCFQTCHVIEIVTKLFLVIQNATQKPPEIHISSEFEANFNQQTVIFSFKCVGQPESHCGQPRVARKGNRMEIVV